VRADERISGRVNVDSEFMSTRAARNSFHYVKKANNTTETTAATAAGRRFDTTLRVRATTGPPPATGQAL
jgi:hypothetical protein